jgi:hypothetical protein
LDLTDKKALEHLTAYQTFFEKSHFAPTEGPKEIETALATFKKYFCDDHDLAVKGEPLPDRGP